MNRSSGLSKLVVLAVVIIVVAAGLAIFGLTLRPQGSGEVSGTLNGAGASFQNPQMQAWASKYYELSGGKVKINYQSIGSGAGQAKFREGILDFAGSDPPLKPEIYQELKAKGGVLQFPVIVGSVAIVYNLPNVEDGELKLTGEAVAKIYLGEIQYWDDPVLKELNPNLSLPHERIIAVHRSDGSGTTKVFTAYLSKVSDEWAKKVGSDLTVQWPVDELGNGIGGKGNEGVAAAVKQNQYSIGYVELAYVLEGGLKMAKLRNKDGNFVLPSMETVMEAVKASALYLPEPDDDWSSVIPDKLLNPSGKNSYPIASFSFIILKGHYSKDKAALIKAFFQWVLTDGQKPENIVKGYVPLPPEVAEKGLKALKMIKVE